MLILNKNIFFVFLFLKNFNFNFCFKSKINFYINNVPSLFRCIKNGPLFYFNHFPTDNEFPCNFSLSSIDQRTIIELDRLELLCETINKKIYINNFLFLSSKCSKDLCRKYLPSSAIMFTEYNKDRIDLIIHKNYSIQIIIAHMINNRINMNYSLKIGDIQTNQIVFQYDEKKYFNMMCE